MRRLVLAAVCSSLALGSDPASAAGPLGENGQSIQTSSYSLDLFMGSVLAGNRVTGMGGAYVAIAEDVDGDLQNPAAPGVRPFYSVDQFDYWPGLGVTFPANATNDFFNTGKRTNLGRSLNTTFVTPALNLQWGTLGFGWSAEVQVYEVPSTAVAEGAPLLFDVAMVTSHYQVADSYFDGQLVVGVGLRRLDFSVALQGTENDQSTSLFEVNGYGTEVGAVWRPHGTRYRLGVAARSAVTTQPRFSRNLLPSEDGDIEIDTPEGAFHLPERVRLPWDVNVGLALHFGARPFNYEWKSREKLAERAFLEARLRQLDDRAGRRQRLAEATTEEERQRLLDSMEAEDERTEERLEREADRAKQRLLDGFANLSHFYVLLSASLKVSGAVSGAVGVESFFNQVVNRSGQRVVLSPHLGAESEVWPDVLKLRAGSYLQPARLDSASQRLHGTLGGDLRLLRWSVFGIWPDDFVWAVGANLDVAARYLTWGLTLTGWYPRPSSTTSPRAPQ